MINLTRSFDKRWIIQKHISSLTNMDSFVETLTSYRLSFDNNDLMNEEKLKGVYKGRSENGESSSMGTRLSQASFYMKGYTKDVGKRQKAFFPSPTTLGIQRNPNSKSLYHFVEFFTMQYPHPYSKTNHEIQLHIGRLISKLLLDERLSCRLYIDEIIWFLPFISKMNQTIYDRLVNSIDEYRKLDFDDKLNLFESVPNSDHVFSNVVHEINYYFIRYFEGVVLRVVEDKSNNNGRLFKFRHGNTSTYRSNAFQSNAKSSGYIELIDQHKDYTKILLESFPFDQVPVSLATKGVNSEDELKFDIFYGQQMEILKNIDQNYFLNDQFLSDLERMKRMSTESSLDGKDFENTLKDVMQYFDRITNSAVLSGAGKTDILCTVDNDGSTYKFNVEAKSRSSSNQANIKRIERHALITSADFTIIVAPRFSRANKLDIHGTNIVLLTAESLYTYMLTFYQRENDNVIKFSPIEKIILKHRGKDISDYVDLLTSTII